MVTLESRNSYPPLRISQRWVELRPLVLVALHHRFAVQSPFAVTSLAKDWFSLKVWEPFCLWLIVSYCVTLTEFSAFLGFFL